MKLKGKKIEGPRIEYVVFPRKDEDIVFAAQAVLDMDEFEKICPPPEAPWVRPAKGDKYQDLKDKKYLEALKEHNENYMNYLILKSLEATEGLEWDTVQINDPSTWNNFKQELKDSGISVIEMNLLVACVMDANSLNQDKLKDALNRFILGLGQDNSE